MRIERLTTNQLINFTISLVLNLINIVFRGRLQTEKWIKHVHGQQSVNKIDAEENPERTYAAVLTADVSFKRVEWSAVKELVNSVPSSSSHMYVVDVSYKLTNGFSRNKDGKASIKSLRKRTSPIVTDKQNGRGKSNPPPVPPKPLNLPSINSSVLFPPSLKARKPIVLEVDESFLPARTSSKRVTPLSRSSKPPVPMRKPILHQNRASLQVSHTMSPRVSESKERQSLRSTTTPPSGEAEEDYNLLNYNVDACSIVEWAYDTEQHVNDQEGTVDDEEEDQYEPISKAPAGQAPPIDTCVSTASVTVTGGGGDSTGPPLNSGPLSTDRVIEDEIRTNLEVKPEIEIDVIAPIDDRTTEMDDNKPGNDSCPTSDVVFHDQPSNGDALQGQETKDTLAPPLEEVNDAASSDGASGDSAFQQQYSSVNPARPQASLCQPRPLSEPISRLSMNCDPLLPQSLTDIDVLGEIGDDDTSSGHSFYEEIGNFDRCRSPSQRSSATYLDPHSSMGYARAAARSVSYRSYHRVTDTDGHKLMTKDSLFMAMVKEACSNSTSTPDTSAPPDTGLRTSDNDGESGKASSIASDPPLVPKAGEKGYEEELLKVLHSTTLAYDKDGNAFYVPTALLAPYGDPSGESWFYPLPLSSRQATLFLNAVHANGCFVIYRLSDSEVTGPRGRGGYNLSVCLDSRVSRDVIHYHIVKNVHGDFMISGHDHSFLTLKDLVKYFRCNKSSLATRLRRFECFQLYHVQFQSLSC